MKEKNDLTKRVLISLADTIRNAHDPFSKEQIEQLASFCSKHNPYFKRERWIRYINGECGSNGGAR